MLKVSSFAVFLRRMQKLKCVKARCMYSISWKMLEIYMEGSENAVCSVDFCSGKLSLCIIRLSFTLKCNERNAEGMMIVKNTYVFQILVLRTAFVLNIRFVY